MKLTNEIKQRFIKDYKLPFNVTEEPLFSYYIDTLDNFYKTKEKLSNLEKFVETFGNESEFFKESSKIIQTIIDSVQRKNIYKTFSNDPMSNQPYIKDVANKDIYSLNNVGGHFFSIDLVKANFQAMKKYSNDLVLGANDYNEFMSKFTDFEYFKNSKQIRQVIFGNLSPKKQQIIQKTMMKEIYDLLLEAGIPNNKFINSSADEIIIKADSKDENLEHIRIAEKIREHGLLPNTRFELFELNNIGNRKFFVKEFYDGNVEFKGIPSQYFLQAFKEYFKIPLNDNDLKFYHDQQLATFDLPLFQNKNLELEFNRE